mgnify:CR=1 FL=1
MSRPSLAVLAVAVGLTPMVGLGPVLGDDVPSFALEMKDGRFTPARLVVPAGKPFRLTVTNAGSGSAEFESKTLHKEKVIAPKTTATVSFKALAKGDYDVFDEYRPEAPAGAIVAE